MTVRHRVQGRSRKISLGTFDAFDIIGFFNFFNFFSFYVVSIRSSAESNSEFWSGHV